MNGNGVAIERNGLADAFDPMGSDDEGENDVIPAPNPTIALQILEMALPPLPAPVKLWVDASPGCGGIAWPAGEVLSRYLVARKADQLRDRRVVELGSGTGLVGLVAGLLGARVAVTDQAQLLPLLSKNVALNGLDAAVCVAELDWAAPVPKDMYDPDILLAADCVYFEPAFPLLCATLRNIATKRTEILFCYKKRRKADKRFFKLLSRDFDWDHVDDDPEKDNYAKDAIYLLRLVKKRP
ncbi:hypothetical protein AURDEDRAFT_110616 [Auricularia subglabra TFB-10046 SS5]|nr:hypothetical protein AURDEDRAFT_110616 [Auricularia subglabra TFB-10046 SS5]